MPFFVFCFIARFQIHFECFSFHGSYILKLIFYLFTIYRKDRSCRLLLFLIILHGTVLHLRMLGVEQTNHFRTCPKHRSVSMRRIYIDRTIIIESRIESHTGAYASAFHLSFFIYLSGDGMPSQLGNRTIRYRINPTFINGVCQTIYIDSSCRSFQIYKVKP